jgi:hypothetical protein
MSAATEDRIEAAASVVLDAMPMPRNTRNMEIGRRVAAAVLALGDSEESVRLVNQGASLVEQAKDLMEEALAAHALVAEALKAVLAQLAPSPSMRADLVWGPLLSAADAALAPSALEASGRRFRVQVREVGTCTRCGCEAEVRSPGKPDEFTCTGALACCACSGRPACEVARG